MSLLIFFKSRHYYFFEKLKIVQKQLGKLNCSYGKVSHPLKLSSSSNYLVLTATILRLIIDELSRFEN